MQDIIDDPQLAAPLGLAIMVGADVDRVAAHVSQGPIKAMGRLLGLSPRPDYKELQGKLQYDCAVLSCISSDLGVATAGREKIAEQMSDSIECLRLVTQSASSLLLLVRYYGKLAAVSRSEAMTAMSEYKDSQDRMAGYQPLLYSLWGPCRANEAVVGEYLLAMLKGSAFEIRHWEEVDPAIAQLLKDRL